MPKPRMKVLSSQHQARSLKRKHTQPHKQYIRCCICQVSNWWKRCAPSLEDTERVCIRHRDVEGSSLSMAGWISSFWLGGRFENVRRRFSRGGRNITSYVHHSIVDAKERKEKTLIQHLTSVQKWLKNQSSSSARWGRKMHSKKIIFICITKQANLVKSSSWQTLINWSNADTGAVYLLQSVWTERLCNHASRYFHHPPLNHGTKKKRKKNKKGVNGGGAIL